MDGLRAAPFLVTDLSLPTTTTPLLRDGWTSRRPLNAIALSRQTTWEFYPERGASLVVHPTGTFGAGAPGAAAGAGGVGTQGGGTMTTGRGGGGGGGRVERREYGVAVVGLSGKCGLLSIF